MTGWAPFLALTVLLTLTLLGLARASQQFIHEHVQSPEEAPGDPEPGTTVPAASQEAQTAAAGDTAVDATPTTTDAEQGSAPIPSIDPATTAPEASDSTGEEGATTHPKQMVLTPKMLLANVAVTQLFVVLVILAAAWYFSIPAAAFGVMAGPLQAGWPGIVLGIGFGLVLWLGNEFATSVADAVGASYDERVRELLAPNSTGGWVLLFLVVLPLIAFAEELLFRGALIGVPAAGFDLSPWLLAILSSIAFALGHGAQGRVGIIVTGVLGLVLAAGFIVTESLLVVVVAHYVINALEFFVHEYLDVGSPIWAPKG